MKFKSNKQRREATENGGGESVDAASLDAVWLSYCDTEQESQEAIETQLELVELWSKYGPTGTPLPSFWESDSTFKHFKNILRRGIPDFRRREIWLHIARVTIDTAAYTAIRRTLFPQGGMPRDCPMYGGFFPNEGSLNLGVLELGEIRRLLCVLHHELPYITYAPMIPSFETETYYVIQSCIRRVVRVQMMYVEMGHTQKHDYKERLCFYDSTRDMTFHMAQFDQLAQKHVKNVSEGYNSTQRCVMVVRQLLHRGAADEMYIQDRRRVSVGGDQDIRSRCTSRIHAGWYARLMSHGFYEQKAMNLSFRTTTVRDGMKREMDSHPQHPLHPFHSIYADVDGIRNHYVSLYKCPEVYGNSNLSLEFPKLALVLRRFVDEQLSTRVTRKSSDFWCIHNTATDGYQLETMFAALEYPPPLPDYIAPMFGMGSSRTNTGPDDGDASMTAAGPSAFSSGSSAISEEAIELARTPSVLVLLTEHNHLIAVFSPDGFYDGGVSNSNKLQGHVHDDPRAIIFHFGEMSQNLQPNLSRVASRMELLSANMNLAQGTFTPQYLMPLSSPNESTLGLMMKFFSHANVYRFDRRAAETEMVMHVCPSFIRIGDGYVVLLYELLIARPTLDISSEYHVVGKASKAFDTGKDWLPKIENQVDIRVAAAELWIVG